MGIVVIGAVFVDIKGYPESSFIPTGRNVGRVEQIHGGVGRNVAEDVANCELRPTFLSLVDETAPERMSSANCKVTRSTRIISAKPLTASEPGWRCSTVTVMWLLPSPSGRI